MKKKKPSKPIPKVRPSRSSKHQGSDRAKYGARLLERLAADLKSRGVQGLGLSILELSRRFFLLYPSLGSQIPSTVSTEFKNLKLG